MSVFILKKKTPKVNKHSCDTESIKLGRENGGKFLIKLKGREEGMA